jgi:putative SOS response-associated peptidase YedK
MEAREVERTFDAIFGSGPPLEFDIKAHGFDHPDMPVITNKESDVIQTSSWGLIPSWSTEEKAKDYANACLNAKAETLYTVNAYKNIADSQRCIIPATSFYEKKWLDSKKKYFEDYEIFFPNKMMFAFAGLWSVWRDKNTFTLLTTTPNKIMQSIHDRMPIVLNIDNSRKWLEGKYNPLQASENSHAQLLSPVMIKTNQSPTLF